MKNPPERADFFVLKTLKPPLFGVSQMGAPQGGFSCPFGAIHLQVAEQSEVGGGTCIGRPLSRCATAACGRPRRSSDSPLDCHSLLRLRFAYPHPSRDRGAFSALMFESRKTKKNRPPKGSVLVRQKGLVCIFFRFLRKKIEVLPPSRPAASNSPPDCCI